MASYRTKYDEQTRTWFGPSKKLLFNPEASLGQVMLEVLMRSPDRVMQRDMDTERSMTYAEFRTRLIRFAQNLTAIGIQQGDVVTLANANSENLAPLACALLTIGAQLSPLAPSFNEDDMTNMLQTTKPKLVFCDDSNYEVVRSALERVVNNGDQMPPLYVIESDRDDVRHAEDLLNGTGREEQFMAPYLGDSRTTLAVILCSSGSTGVHKGIKLTHASCAQIGMSGGFSSIPHVQFRFSPLYWLSGFLSMLGVFISGAIRLITRNDFNVHGFFDAIEEHRAANVFAPPAYASTILAHPRATSVDFSSVRMWGIGGSFVPDKLRDRIDALLAPTGGRSISVYGLSEIGGVASDVVKRVPNAIGPLLPNMVVRIVDENGNRLGVGGEGEIIVKSIEEFCGYYSNEEDSIAVIDPDGFFRSGDIGFFDEDGYLHVVDRQTDIFNYQCYYVTPSDLETVIRRIEGVQDVCVVGIMDEDRATNVPAAAIVRLPDAPDLEASQVRTIVDGQVSDFKRLRGGVYFVEELPKTHSGKILRRKVAEMIKRLEQCEESEVTG